MWIFVFILGFWLNRCAETRQAQSRFLSLSCEKCGGLHFKPVKSVQWLHFLQVKSVTLLHKKQDKRCTEQ